ncbi:putative bifunctional diguanylate cyclase/phosphodiesterase, partial [Pseudomonadota bacterium]
VYPKLLSINAASVNGEATSHYIGIFTDISHLKDNEKKLRYLAFYDVLTGLPNRQLFQDRYEHELVNAKRHKTIVALLFIDIDNFKHVNDTLGHHIGDKLLKEVANRLQESTREADTVARLGGDEFTIILNYLDTDESISMVARKVVKSIAQPFSISGHDIFVGASIGISLYPEDGEDKEVLLRNADAAMYYAKESGRSTFKFFSEDINQRNQQRRIIENSMRRALKNGELEIYYQPQIDSNSGEIVCAEALLRWNDPERGLIPPLDFIPIAEESGIIMEIGDWVLQEACCWLHHQFDKGGRPPRIAINLSAVQFRNDGLVTLINSTLDREQIPPEWIELEITESILMQDAQRTEAILNELSTLGIRIAIDDFGTGYSSLAYLKNFPVDQIKIDRAFIAGLPNNEDDVVLTTTMIMLAKNLGIDILAEGTETLEQIEFLRKNGCRFVQGCYYSKPLPEKEWDIYLAKNQSVCMNHI